MANLWRNADGNIVLVPGTNNIMYSDTCCCGCPRIDGDLTKTYTMVLSKSGDPATFATVGLSWGTVTTGGNTYNILKGNIADTCAGGSTDYFQLWHAADWSDAGGTGVDLTDKCFVLGIAIALTEPAGLFTSVPVAEDYYDTNPFEAGFTAGSTGYHRTYQCFPFVGSDIVVTEDP